MFTGIVETLGTVVTVQRRGGGAYLQVRCPQIARDVQIGESVAVNGACVTVTETDGTSFACDLVPETVARTNLGILAVEEEVNLERAVRATDRLGGHIVQGHVDAVGVVRTRRKVGAQEIVEVTIPFELSRYLAPQGSVTLDGVSLTVVSVDRDRFKVALIPHTVAATTLGRKLQQASVNVEVDVLSKYVERHLAVRKQRASLGAFFDDLHDTAHEGVEAPKPPPPPLVQKNQQRPSPQQTRSRSRAKASTKPAATKASPAKKAVAARKTGASRSTPPVRKSTARAPKRGR